MGLVLSVAYFIQVSSTQYLFDCSIEFHVSNNDPDRDLDSLNIHVRINIWISFDYCHHNIYEPIHSYP